MTWQADSVDDRTNHHQRAAGTVTWPSPTPSSSLSSALALVGFLRAEGPTLALAAGDLLLRAEGRPRAPPSSSCSLPLL